MMARPQWLARISGTVLVLGLALVWPGSPAAAEGPAINGGGSSFAALEIDQWRADVARKPFELKINYVAQGSTFGRLQYASGSLDFGASDIPFQPGELPAGSPRANFAYVPVSAGGIGFMYNLVDGAGQKVNDLKLTRKVACRMFSEPGMRWNDPELVAQNPRLSGVNREIKPIVRQDGSGTSFVFSEFCISVARPTWDAFVALLRASNEGGLSDDFKAGRPISSWPTGWGRVTSALAADGVANAVADPVSGKDAITYNEAGFAKVRDFPNAQVQNAAGLFVAPTEEAVTVALGYAIPNTPGGAEDGTFTLNYTGPDDRAYFPSTYSYIIAQTGGAPADKGAVLSRFLCYSVSKGQEVAIPLGYARLSTVLVDLAVRQITKIPGAPAAGDCPVKDAAPPPPPPTPEPQAPGGGGTNPGGGGTSPGGAAPGNGTTPGDGSPAGGNAPAPGAGGPTPGGGAGPAAAGTDGADGAGGTGAATGSAPGGGNLILSDDGKTVLGLDTDGDGAADEELVDENGQLLSVEAAAAAVGNGSLARRTVGSAATASGTGGDMEMALDDDPVSAVAGGDVARLMVEGAALAALVTWMTGRLRRSE